jgi:hypothetical protein
MHSHRGGGYMTRKSTTTGARTATSAVPSVVRGPEQAEAVYDELLQLFDRHS